MKSLLFKLVQIILYWEASVWRSRYSGPVIAITGSVGKTSTKDIIGLVVRQEFGDKTLVAPKSLNTEIGVPLTMLGFKSEPTSFLSWITVMFKGLIVAYWGSMPTCVVLELGADQKGNIAYLGRLTKPSHAVITNISESHSQFLGTLEDIRQEKTSLLGFVDLNGWIILNGDDPYMAALRVQPTQHKVLIRLQDRADYYVSGIKVGLDGTDAVMHYKNRTQRLHIERFGGHHLVGVLCAAAIGDSLGIDRTKQLAAFKAVKPVPGRGMLIPGKKGSLLLDESYNAQPEAMRASLEVLKELPAKRRVAILGDMRELKDPAPVHKTIGKVAHETADYVIAVGPLARHYQANEWFATSLEAIPAALRQLGPGVIVLIKGSQNTIRLERVVKALMRSPQDAEHLLVRQEKVWANRP